MLQIVKTTYPNFFEENSDMRGFKEFLADDWRRKGEFLDIQDLRQTQFLR